MNLLEYLRGVLEKRKAEHADTKKRIKESKDIEEVRALGETLTSLATEISEAEARIAELEAEGEGTSGEGEGEGEGGESGVGARGVNPMHTYFTRSTQFQGNETRATSLGEHFTRSVGESVQSAHQAGGRFSISAPEFRANTDIQVTGGAGSGGVLDSFLVETDSTIVQAFRRPSIASLFSWGSISRAAIEYFVEGAREGDFDTVAETGAKPQIHYKDPEKKLDALIKIAGFIKISDEMLEDLPYLVTEINGRLLYDLSMKEETQLLYGDGTGNNLLGLLNRSGIQTLTSAAVTDNVDTIFKTRTLIANATGLSANGIIINPTDYQDFRLGKDNNGQYYGGGYFSGQYGNASVMTDPPLWGIQTIISPAVAEKTVVVGNFSPVAATAYRKGGVRVESTNSHDDDFTNNLVTIRAEERIALAVRRPASFVKVTLA